MVAAAKRLPSLDWPQFSRVVDNLSRLAINRTAVSTRDIPRGGRPRALPVLEWARSDKSLVEFLREME